jgi:RNA polymerase sigma-70 factor (ECF subfamily)
MSNKLEHQTILDFMQGLEKAYELVFKAYYGPLMVFSTKLCDDDKEGEDIVMGVFQALFQRHKRFNSEEHIKAFLYISARNRCLNFLKARKKHAVGSIEQAERLQDDTLLVYEYEIRAEIVAAIHTAIESLPDQCRHIFKLLYYEERKPTEVAEQLQISVNTVYVQKSRAVSMLRMRLSDNSLAITWFIYSLALLQMNLYPAH